MKDTQFKNNRYDFRIETNIIETLLNTLELQENQVTKAIHEAIETCILKTVDFRKRNDYKRTRKTLGYTFGILDKKIAFREKDLYIETLKSFYNVTEYSLAIRYAILDVIHEKFASKKILPQQKIFYLHGQKNSEMCAILQEIFNDIKGRYPITQYIEPFTGTGNVFLHTQVANHNSLNDNSEEITNLLKILQNYPCRLKVSLINLEYNKESFIIQRNLLRAFHKSEIKLTNLERAIAFYYTRFASIRCRGADFNHKRTYTNLIVQLNSIYPLSRELQNVKITKNDALYFAKKHMLFGSVLYYIDSPYFYTETYYKEYNSKGKVFNSHRALANFINKATLYENIFVLNNRITASKAMQKKNITQETLIKLSDQLYAGKGFYKRLHEISTTDKQIDIFISNVEFIGSTPYDIPLAQEGIVLDNLSVEDIEIFA